MSYVYYIFCLFRKKSKFLFFSEKRGILCFFSFLGRQGVCHRSYISCSALRKSNLRSSLSRKQLVCWVDFILFLKRFVLIVRQKVVKALDLETTLNFKKMVERIA